MIEEFKRIPEPLQKQTLKHFGLGILFLVLLAVLFTIAMDPLLLLPCAGAAAFFILAAFRLFRRAVIEDYVVIRGECLEVGRTAIKHRAKYLLMKTESGTLKVLLHNRTHMIKKGSAITIFVLKSTSVYEENDAKMLYTYITIDIK